MQMKSFLLLKKLKNAELSNLKLAPKKNLS